MSHQMLDQPGSWRKIRPSIRFYCYRAAEVLAEGRELAEVRPRPWAPDLAADRPHLIRALSDREWSDEKSSDEVPFYFEIRLYDLVLEVCQRGVQFPIAWGLILELLDATAGKASVKTLASQPVGSPDKDDGVVVLSIAPGSVNQYAAGIFQGEKPKWNPKLHTLSHNGTLLRRYPSGKGNQCDVLMAFEDKGWPEAVPVKDKVTKQTAQDINEIIKKTKSRLRFQYKKETSEMAWYLES